MLSSCGLLCEDCYAFANECPGCECIEGKPFWVNETGSGVCELYQCAGDQGMTSCGDCAALPCRQCVELRDPNLSMEAHLHNVNDRVRKLRMASQSCHPVVCIQPRDSFCVAGYAFATSANRSRAEIPGFWDKFFESCGLEKLAQFVDGGARTGTYGICTDFNCDSGRFSYVIGVESKLDGDVPEGMVKVTVSAGLYVMAEVPLDVPAIHSAWDYILQTWMPAAGYSHAGTEDFEFYPEECGCEVWVPIK